MYILLETMRRWSNVSYDMIEQAIKDVDVQYLNLDKINPVMRGIKSHDWR